MVSTRRWGLNLSPLTSSTILLEVVMPARRMTRALPVKRLRDSSLTLCTVPPSPIGMALPMQVRRRPCHRCLPPRRPHHRSPHVSSTYRCAPTLSFPSWPMCEIENPPVLKLNEYRGILRLCMEIQLLSVLRLGVAEKPVADDGLALGGEHTLRVELDAVDVVVLVA